MNYLKYLRYWKKPVYAKYIVYGGVVRGEGGGWRRSLMTVVLSAPCVCGSRYPHCLYFLDLLQRESFRAAIANPHNTDLMYAPRSCGCCWCC